jgi:glycosyltransferase involved in cell wall biosynthesis
MMVAPQVSVLLPYRDAEATIEEALRSVLDQRDVTFEVLAVDEC